MQNPYRRRFQQARRVISDIYKLVSLGYISKKALGKISKMTTSEQKQFARNVRKKNMPKGELSKLRKQVKDINKKLAYDDSLCRYKACQYDSLTSSVNQTAYQSYNITSDSILDASIANLRYFDPSTPGTLITADVGTTAYQSETLIKVFSTITCRNNYQVPLELDIYLCRCRGDTSIAPQTAFTNGMSDQGGPTSTSMLLYPSDSDEFNSLWKIAKHQRYVLEPGRQVSLSCSSKQITYSPSLADSHSFAYLHKNQGMVWLVRIHGVVAHDSSLDQQGLIASGVDVTCKVVCDVRYDSGGPALNDVVISDGFSAFTNGAVVANKPVSDNQAYSQA